MARKIRTVALFYCVRDGGALAAPVFGRLLANSFARSREGGLPTARTFDPPKETPEPISANAPTCIVAPIMRQSWHNVSFIHWRCEPAIVRRLIPLELELDLFSGDCWIGLVPFLITDLTIPKGPALPWLSAFPETNVRTYVTDRNGRRGVWFFSLDAARLLAVVGARVGFGLPYFWSRMKILAGPELVRYSSTRYTGSRAMSDIAVAIGAPIASPTLLEVFLTARFRLYTQRRAGLAMAEIWHQPWPLHKASIIELRETLAHAASLPPADSSPLVHFAPRVDVIGGAPRLVGRKPNNVFGLSLARLACADLARRVL